MRRVCVRGPVARTETLRQPLVPASSPTPLPSQNWEATLKSLLMQSASHVEVVSWKFVYRRLVSHYVYV